jgi:AcrR family transcriptional regulator
MKKKAGAKDRPRGRPMETDQGSLKAKILDVAEELFSEQGYAATSIRQIAEQAGVNPALVHYYFENKRNLLETVMERVLEPLAKAIARMDADQHASPQQIAGLIISMAARHPNIPRLMIREVILPGAEMQNLFIEKLAPQLGGALPALLEREKAAGRLRKDADASISAVLIMAVCIFPFVARTLAEPALGVRYDEQGIELLGRQIADLFQRGLLR